MSRLTAILSGAILSALLLARPVAPCPRGETQMPIAGDAISRQPQIRKLHLVRPDLILYPIAHEVIC